MLIENLPGQKAGRLFILTAVLIIGLASLVVFFHLGSVPLLDPDEPVYAETAREMIQSHDYISPRIYHEFWYDKPPMYYWLVAASYHLFGTNEFAARFPSALLAVCGVLLIYAAGWQLLSRRAAVLAALVLTTSLEYFYLAKAAVTDMTLTFFLTAALLAFLRHRYYLFYSCVALSVVTKGPIGLLFAGGIVFIYLCTTHNLRQLRHMRLWQGSLLFMAIALPWYLLMYHYHGWDFINTFLGFHNITRFLQPEHPEGTLWYYYIPVLIIGFFPWSSVLVQACYTAVRQADGEQKHMLRFFAIWAATVFIFFSVSQTKLVSYILPMYPPLAFLVGWYLDKLWAKNDYQHLYSMVGILVGLLLILGGALVFTGHRLMPEIASGARLCAALFGLIAITAGLTAYHRNYHTVIVSIMGGTVLFFAILVTQIFPAVAPGFSMAAFSGEFLQNYDGKSPVYVAKFYRPGLAFYTGYPGIELSSVEQIPERLQAHRKAYFIFKQKEYMRLSPELSKRLTVVLQQADKIMLVYDGSE